VELRSTVKQTIGASSPYDSRTMKWSSPRIAESRAEVAQSMRRMSSPTWYGRPLTTSSDVPRRRLCALPKSEPMILTCGSSSSSGEELMAALRARPRRPVEAGLPDVRPAVERRPQDQAMVDDEREEELDVVRHDVVPAAEQRPRAGEAVERQRAAHRGADPRGLELPRRRDEGDDPAAQRRRDVDVLDRVLEPAGLLERRHRLQRGERVADDLRVEDVHLVLERRVAEPHADVEAVELGFGQRERPCVLERVLRGEHEEGRVEPARLAVDRHLSLGHRLEECRLRLRHRPVDLVDEEDVREDRAGPEDERTALLVVDREARDVERLEIRRALDARRDRALDRSRHGAGEHRLRGAGDVLEEDVASRGEGGDDALDLRRLAAHDAADVLAARARDMLRLGDRVRDLGAEAFAWPESTTRVHRSSLR